MYCKKWLTDRRGYTVCEQPFALKSYSGLLTSNKDNSIPEFVKFHILFRLLHKHYADGTYQFH